MPARGVSAEGPVPESLREVGGLRTANSDTFVKSDGTFLTHVYPQPVNFRDAGGQWRKIDARFAVSDRAAYLLASGSVGYRADFKSALGVGAVRFEAGQGPPFTLTPLDASSVTVTSGTSELSYPDAWKDASLRYQLLPDGVKESIVLGGPAAPSSYVFALHSTDDARLKAVEQLDGSVAFYADGGGAPAFVLLAPIVNDSSTALGIPDPAKWPAGAPPGSTPANGGVRPKVVAQNIQLASPVVGKASLGVQRQADGSFRVTVAVDQKWLSDPARVFPVVIDPTISTQADILDGYWNTASGSSTPNMSDPEVYAGYDGSGANYAAALKFNLAMIPPAATVTSAKVNVYATRCVPTSTGQYASYGCPYWWPGSGAYSSTMELYQVTNAWSSSTQWQNLTVDSTSLGSFGGQFYQSTGTRIPNWFTFAGTSLAGKVQAIVNGTVANNGFLLKKTGGDASGLTFAGSRYADTSVAPRMDIEWSAEGSQLSDVVHVHSNGAELFWQHYSGGLGPYAQAIRSDNPAAYWRLDDPVGSPLGIADWSGNENNGGSSIGVTLGQAGATSDGDQGAGFNGSSGFVETGGGSLVNIADTFTIEAFIKRSNTALARYTIFSRGESNGGGFRLEINNNNQLELANGTCDGCANGNFTAVAVSSTSLADTSWHYVAATKSGGSIHLYIDGNDVTGWTNNRTMTVGWNFVDLGDNVFFDYAQGATGRDSYFAGQIDDAAVYDHVLSGTQIAAHYAARLLTIADFDRYEIHRSVTSGFTPSAATLIASIKDAAIQNYRDTTARPGTTFYYKILTYTNGGANSFMSTEVAATTPAAGQAQISIQAGVAGGTVKATSISSASGCANQGAAQTLPVDASDRAILQFDLRQIPNGATVTSASLNLFTFATPAATIEAHRMTSDWTEGTAINPSCDGSGATWASRNPSVSWASAGGDYDPANVTVNVPGGNPHWDNWNVTSTVQGWLNGSNANLGFLLKQQTEAGAPTNAYVSNEYSNSLALRPQLVINYTDSSVSAGPSVGITIQGLSALPGVTPAVTGTATVNAGASDDGQVTAVQFKLDGTNLGTADTSAPYSTSWNTTTAAHGSHTLTAVATDDAGNQTTSAGLSVSVANSASPATSITSASAGTATNYTSTVSGTPPTAYWRLGETGSSFGSNVGSFTGTWANASSSAVSRTGSVTTIKNGANSGSQAVTVPADATLAVVTIEGYNPTTDIITGNAPTLGGTATTLAKFQRDSAADGNQVGIFTLGSPAIGSQTFAWNWGGSAAWADGGQMNVVFYKGVNTTTPVGAIGGGFTENAAANTPASAGTLTASSGDAIVAASYYYPAGTLTWTGVTSVNNSAFNGSSGSFAEGFPSGNTTVSASHGFGNNYVVVTAIVLKQAGSGALPGSVGGSLSGDSNTARSLDGSAQYGTVPNNASLSYTNNFSVELWLKRTNSGTLQAVAGKPLTSTTQNENYAIWITAANKVEFQTGNGTTSQILDSTGAITDTSWHHVVATFASGAMKMYVDNGAPATATAPFTTVVTNTATLDIGRSATSNYFNGSLDEIALYPTALTANQVGSHYTLGTNGPTSGSTWTVSATASDDYSVSKVEFLVDGKRFATKTSSPWTATLDTLGTALPVYDGSHTLTTKAYDADGNATTAAGYPITVTNSGGTPYQGTLTTTSYVPREMRYDATAGTQDSAPVTVGLTNNSIASWPTTSIKLRYRWLNQDGSELSHSADISIGSDLAAAGVRNIATTVQPPTLPGWQMRGRFMLRFDLWDTSCSCYFASKGNQPLDQIVTATRIQPDELGLERYQQYDGTHLGGGMSSTVNLFNGNQTVNWTPYNEPGLGLNTVVGLTYNSLEDGSVSPLGNNWSLAIGGLTPLGLPLDIHPNAADTAAGRTGKWVGFTDADGTYHRLNGNASGTYYTAPAGVHLYFKIDTGDAQRYYGLIKPDRTASYYDSGGYPTRVEDGDGNALVFTEAAVAAGDDAYGLAKQITAITDANGRSFTLGYYTAASTTAPALRGKVKSITDHIGRQLTFSYYDDGNLLRLIEKGGQNADGSYLPDRSFVFTYTTASGSGPAIPGATSARMNPDPATGESARLYSVIDFRGNETSWSYATSGGAQWRVTGVTNRAGEQTSYAYNTVTSTTTVSKPLSRISSYSFDANGRPTSATDPLNETFNLAWTDDNMPQTITNAATSKYTEFAYNVNGQLTDTWDELRDHTTISYQNLAIDSGDVTGNWEIGRTIGHISRPTSRVLPTGNATGGNATDYRTSFDYTNNTTDHVFHVTDPLGNITTNTYNANGTLASQTLPSNSPFDTTTRTTTYNTYDNNGFATKSTDPAGAIIQASYDAAGNLLSAQDPNHGSYAGGDPSQYRSVSYYDSYGRAVRSSTPRSTLRRPGLLTWTDTSYDANDNPSGQQNPHYGTGDAAIAVATSTTYDAMDRPVVVTGPRSAADGGPVKTQTVYDGAGRPYQVTTPNGVNSGIAKQGMTQAVYDALDRPVQTIQYAITGGSVDAARTRTTNYCYDIAGDLRSVTGPKGAAGFTNCPSATASPYVYTTAPNTTKTQYDATHRKTKTTDPSGNVAAQTVYNENGLVTQTTDANNKATQYTYSDRGEKIKEVDPFDSTTTRTTTAQWTYDNLGNLASYISPRAYDAAGGSAPFTSYVTKYHYDADRRLTSTDLPTDANTAAAYSYTAYDSNGNKTMISLPSSQSNPANLASTEKTSDSYWDNGAIYSQTDPATPTVRFDYTAEGWQTNRTPESATQPGALDYSRAMFWDYYPDGLPKSLRDIGGERAYYNYDADGNQTNATEATGITRALQNSLTIQKTFNDLDQLTKVRVPKTGSSNWFATTYGYDLHGRTTQMIDNLEETSDGSQVNPGRVFNYSFNDLDQATSQTDDFNTAADPTDDEQTTYSYTATGLLDTRTLSKKNGASWAQEQKVGRTYYDNGLVKQLTNYDGANAIVEQHTLGYTSGTGAGIYNDGNKTTDIFKIKNADGGATCWIATCTGGWAYDAQDRLTQEISGTGTTANFTLDPEGNITQRTAGSVTTTNTYIGQQLSTTTTTGVTSNYIYDSSGNVDCIVTSGFTCPAAGNSALLTDFIYDYKNRLADYRAYNGGSLTDSSDYINDPLDRPVVETETHSGASTTTNFRYVGTTNAVSREDLTGATAATKTYSYDANGLRLAIAVTPQGLPTSRFSYLNDTHGSVSLLVDQTSTVELSYGYGAYGTSNAALTKTAPGFSASTNQYQYSGKRWDSGSQTYDMGTRHYSTSAARFLQQDIYAGAFADLGLATSPTTANRYLFTGANPVGFVELDGHRVAPEDSGTCTPGGIGCLAADPGSTSPQLNPPPAPGPGATTTSGNVAAMRPGNPGNIACTFENGCADLSDQDFVNASWDQREAWIAAINKMFDGWFNNIAGILDYFKGSSYFKNDQRLRAADGYVLWDIALGIRSFRGAIPLTKWGKFLAKEKEGGTSLGALKTLWGTAELDGVEFSTELTRGLPETADQAGLYASFKVFGDTYRRDVITGKLGRDPRHDRTLVYVLANVWELAYTHLG